MPRFSLTIPDVATGAAANTFKSLVGLVFADTLGHRARLLKLTVGAAHEAAADINISLKLMRTNSTTPGTLTAVNVNAIGKHDTLSVASKVSAIGHTYTVEPTTFGTEQFGGGGMNGRSTYYELWEPGQGPQWNRNTTLILLGAPGIATAVALTVALEWEE